MAQSILDLVSTVYPVVPAMHPYGPQGASAPVLLHAAVMSYNGLNEIISTDDGYD